MRSRSDEQLVVHVVYRGVFCVLFTTIGSATCTRGWEWNAHAKRHRRSQSCMHAVKSVRGPAAGYLIGLGDRHSHNILLQEGTADVVHIDLGVAFEQVCAPAACGIAMYVSPEP